jgi:hypothetical protein
LLPYRVVYVSAIHAEPSELAQGTPFRGLFLDLPLGAAGAPSFLAGLISFLAPGVLPLVPAYVGYWSGRSVKVS